MACVDIQVLVQLVVYFCIFLCGFLVSIPVGLNKTNFDGQCMLYAEVKALNNIVQSDVKNCDFPVYYGVLGMIIAAVVLGLYYVYGVYKSIRDPDFGPKMFVLPLIPLNAILCVLTLVIASMISVGFRQFCDGIEKQIPRCDGVVKYNNSDTGPFVSRYKIAQAGAWLGFLLYLAQTGLCILRFVRNRHHTKKPVAETLPPKEDISASNHI